MLPGPNRPGLIEVSGKPGNGASSLAFRGLIAPASLKCIRHGGRGGGPPKPSGA